MATYVPTAAADIQPGQRIAVGHYVETVDDVEHLGYEVRISYTVGTVEREITLDAFDTVLVRA